MGYLARGNACALDIPMHDQYPFNNQDQNNLTHVGRVMYYPSKFENSCYGARCTYGITYKGYYRCIMKF
jgi:hypothetical protein